MVKIFFSFLTGVVAGAYIIIGEPSGVVASVAELIKALILR